MDANWKALDIIKVTRGRFLKYFAAHLHVVLHSLVESLGNGNCCTKEFEESLLGVGKGHSLELKNWYKLSLKELSLGENGNRVY